MNIWQINNINSFPLCLAINVLHVLPSLLIMIYWQQQCQTYIYIRIILANCISHISSLHTPHYFCGIRNSNNDSMATETKGTYSGLKVKKQTKNKNNIATPLGGAVVLSQWCTGRTPARCRHKVLQQVRVNLTFLVRCNLVTLFIVPPLGSGYCPPFCRPPQSSKPPKRSARQAGKTVFAAAKPRNYMVTRCTAAPKRLYPIN